MRPAVDPRRTAAALGYALLRSDWQGDTLRSTSTAVLLRSGAERGEVRRRAAEIVAEDLARFPRPPLDQARALLRLLELSEPLAAVLHPGVPAPSLTPPATAMVRNPWSLPVLHDVPGLADWLHLDVPRLLWLADPQRRLRRIRPGPLHVYERVWLRRGARTPRLLEAPTPMLKRVQHVLLDDLVGAVPAHSAAHGFVAGRSVLTHARRHQAHELLISLDLRSFFSAVRTARVRGIFQAAGYPEAVAVLLAGLTTTATPVRVLRAMPPGGALDDRVALTRLLRAGPLAQGAPTSPALANAVCYRLDRRLEAYAAARGLSYSRYADDLAFSGPNMRRPGLTRFLAWVAATTRDEGFALNPAKSRVSTRSGRQQVTGLVVNQRPNVTRSEMERLRALLHDAVRHGPEAANRADHPDFRRHLEGRVAWVSAVNPERARRARNLLAQIRWP